MNNTALPVAHPHAHGNSGVNAWRFFVLIALVTVATLGRVVTHEFVDFDDGNLLAINPNFNPPTFHSIFGYLLPRNADEDLYIPTTQLVWGLLAAIGHTDHPDASGSLLNPWVFHAANLALHIASAGMVLTILRSFVGDASACVGALIFAVHPVQVETVAWASGLRDLLSALLGLVCLYQLIQFRMSGRLWRWAIATVAVALSMLAKPSAVALPLEAMVLDIILLRTRPLRSLTALLPWFLFAIPIIMVTRHVQPMVWPIDSPWSQRPLIALDATAFYMVKLFAPFHLALDYGRTPAVALADGWRAIWMLPLLLAAALLWKGKHLRKLTAGVLIAVAGVVPVLGLISFQAQAYSTVSDHYLYPSMLGIALIAAAGFEAATTRLGSLVASLAAAIIVALLAIQAFALAGVWSDSYSLFSYTLSINPRSSNANSGLAAALTEQGDIPGAIAHFRLAEQLNPRNGVAMMGLGNLLLREGDIDGAADQYESLMRVYQSQSNFDPRLGAEAEVVVASRLLRRGQTVAAVAALKQAKQWDPLNPQIDAMLARAARSSSSQPAPLAHEAS